MKQPRLAVMVADALRERILTGDLEDGAFFPKQEDLITEFKVSPPSVREALLILEIEGLITVQRGHLGGAVVHRPNASKVAYMVGLVLQSRSVSIADLMDGMRQIEPTCAAACALRVDRRETVLPLLRRLLDDGLKAIDDLEAHVNLARRFYIAIGENCGNQTASLIVSTLETLLAAQVNTPAQRARRRSLFADRNLRLKFCDEREHIYGLIQDGDSRGAEGAMRDHYELVDQIVTKHDETYLENQETLTALLVK